MLNNSRPEIEARRELVQNRIAFLDKSISDMSLELVTYSRELEILEQLYRLYKDLPEDPIDTERKQYNTASPQPQKTTKAKQRRNNTTMHNNIMHLLNELGGLTTREIADYLEIEPPVVSKQVYSMKKRGYLISKDYGNGKRHFIKEGADDN